MAAAVEPTTAAWTSSSARTDPVQDVRFKQLGLVIIDREHRFGVRQETLKALRAEVDDAD